MSGEVRMSGDKEEPLIKKLKPSDEEDLKMNTSTDCFDDLRFLPAFVDKSLIIRDLIKSPSLVLITAPRKFGKSSNLSMIRRFLEYPKDQCLREDRIKLFQGLAIYEEKDIVNNHMFQFPIIYLNFSSHGKIDSYDTALSVIREAVHAAYLEHIDLLDVELPKPKDAKLKLTRWCDRNTFAEQAITDLDLFEALKDLSAILKQHYRRRVVVLVDEYDSVCSDAIFGVKALKGRDRKAGSVNTIIEDIISLCVGCLSGLLRYNDDNIERGIITGISYLATLSLSSKLGHIDRYMFQEDTKFSRYYGLTTDECQALLQQFGYEEQWDAIRNHYNGYKNNMLSTWSVMNFLNKNAIDNYWRECGVVANLYDTLKVPIVRSLVNKLLSHFDNQIEIQYLPVINFDCIKNLKKILNGSDLKMNEVSIFFMFLLVQGYLKIISFDQGKNNVILKLPNKEIRSEFELLLQQYYKTNLKVSMLFVQECASIIDNFTLDDDRNKALSDKLVEKLNKLFKNMKVKRWDEAILHHVMFLVLFSCKTFRCYSEIRASFKNSSRLDLLLLGLNIGIIVELKFGETSRIALQQILKNKYKDAFLNQTYNPEEINVEYYILIGLNMDKKKIITLSILLNNEDFKESIDFTVTE